MASCLRKLALGQVTQNSVELKLNSVLSKEAAPLTNCVSVPTRGGAGFGYDIEKGDIRADGTALIVTGILDCLKADIDPAEIAHVVFGTVLPSFNKEDIISVRKSLPLR